MKRIAYWTYFNAGDFFRLHFGLLLDTFFKRIPRKIFLAKNILDYIANENGQFIKRKDEICIDLHGTKFILRTVGSDLDVFNQLIIEQGLKRIIALMNGLQRQELNVMDCGANIGLATILLRKNFPQARIISLEPEKSNYQQLCKNIEANAYSNITALPMGVWYEQDVLVSDNTFRDGEHWSFALKPGKVDSNSGVAVNSPQEIARLQKWGRIDVLKIDIEGSEFALFRNLERWKSILVNVQIISIEVHEEVGPLFEIAELLWQNGFKLEVHGELLIGVRN